MADQDTQLYGPEYEEELFKKLSPAVEERIRAQYKNRGVSFGREGGDVSEALNKLKQEIALQVAQQNASLKSQLVLRKTAEDERIREEQRAQARESEKRGYEQTKEDRNRLAYQDLYSKQQEAATSKEYRDRFQHLIDAGYKPPQMAEYHAGTLSGQQGKDVVPDWKQAYSSFVHDIGRQMSDDGQQQSGPTGITGAFKPYESAVPMTAGDDNGYEQDLPKQGFPLNQTMAPKGFAPFDEADKRRRGFL